MDDPKWNVESFFGGALFLSLVGVEMHSFVEELLSSNSTMF